MYERIASKFHKSESLWLEWYGIFEAMVARDELYSESGRATVDDGNLNFTAEKKTTAEEVFDLEDEYIKWCESFGYNPTEMTLDERLKENAKTHIKTDDMSVDDIHILEEYRKQDTTLPETDDDTDIYTALLEIDGVLEASDGLITIENSSETEYEYSNMLFKIFECIRDYPIAAQRKITALRVGDATITLSQTPSDCNDYINFSVSSVTAYGQTVSPIQYDGEPFELLMMYDKELQAFWADDYFVIANVDPYVYGSTYIFYDGGYEVVTCTTSDDTSIEFFEKDGKLTFTEKAVKFFDANAQQLLSEVLVKCVSRDEFYIRSGSAKLVNGKLSLTATETFTVSEKIDMELYWGYTCEIYNIDPTEVTLDEFLAENAKKYEKATTYGE